MLQLITKYYKSFLGLFVVTLMALSMLFFGVDFGGGRGGQSYAVKVGDFEVPQSEFYQRKSEIQRRFAAQFGENYAQLAPQLLKNLDEQVSEQLINELVYKNVAKDLGFAPGKDYVKRVAANIFPDGFTKAKYQNFLLAQGLTSSQFEKRLSGDSLMQQFRSLYQQLSLNPPENFVRASFEESEKRYSVNVMTFDPEGYLGQISEPDDEALKVFYEDRLIDYEEDPKVRARYVTYVADNFSEKVDVLDEDIELFYTDNQRKYRNPERVKVQEVVLNIPTGEASIGESVGIQSLANDLRIRIEGGEDISAIASQYSDEALKGGVSDWISRGKSPKAFDEQIFGEEVNDEDLFFIEEPKRYRLVKVVEREQSSLKPLDEVREQISKEIVKQEAPIYASDQAYADFDKWQESTESIEEFAKQHKLSIQSIGELTSLKSASAAVRPIVKASLEDRDAKKLLVDLGRSLALVFVEEFKEADIPAFGDIREKIVKDFKQVEAQKMVREKAEELALQLRENEGKEQGAFNEALVQSVGASLEKVSDKKLSELTNAPLASAQIRRELPGASTGALVNNEPYLINGKQYLVWLDSVKAPEEESFVEKKEELQRASTQSLARLVEQGVLNALRAKADIEGL